MIKKRGKRKNTSLKYITGEYVPPGRKGVPRTPQNKRLKALIMKEKKLREEV